MGDEILASFGFHGDNLDPDTVTSSLGITPRRAHRKGEPIEKSPEGKYPTGVWRTDSDLPREEAIDVHLSNLLDRLEPKAAEIKQLISSGYRARFFCSYFMDRTSGRVDLPSTVLVRIAALGVGLIVDTYYWAEEESGEE